MLLHSLINFKLQKCYQNDPKFNGVYSPNSSSKINDGVKIIKVVRSQYESIGTHWIALYVNASNVTYFDNFGVEHIPIKTENSLEIKVL